MYLPIPRITLKKKKKKKKSSKNLSNDAYAMCLCIFLSDSLYKSRCCGYPFELHRQVDAIQKGTYNICLYKEVDKCTLAVF